ncbi:hypothetical protein [Lederbergia ruris]|uniref:pPIWI_RE_Z domain-containing protein n=1 Tax=Lederbergia ruris TaxID=217495 RepID=UPI0039A391E0
MTIHIREPLKNDKDISGAMDVLIPIELMTVGCEMMNTHIPLHQAWVLLTGYDNPILPKHVPESILMRLRMLMSPYSGETTWKSLLDEYMDLPQHHQLIDIDDEYQFSFMMPRFDPNRKEKYKQILLNPIPFKQSDKKFAKEGKFTYSKFVDQIRTPISGSIPKSWVKEISLLEEYRPKKELNFHVNFNWVEIAKEMDKVLDNERNEWQQKLQPIQLQAIKKDMKLFEYKGLQHIAGGLASGKSTFRTVNTYWLVKHKNQKVGIIAGSVAEVLEEVQRLRNLGIHAVPIIGKGNRKNHLKNYLQSQVVTSATELADDETMKHLSGVCTLKTLANDIDETKSEYYPCENVIQGGKTPKLCPLIQQCGIYKDWTKLKEADVWVTTSAAVLSTRIPATIDPFKRSIYEAMYDLLDVIFVDEADHVQKQFEETFLNEYPAFGNPSHLVETLDRQFFEQIQDNYNLVDNVYISEWQMNLHHLKENVRQLLGEVKISRRLRDFVKHKVIYLSYLIHDIAETLARDEEHYKKIKENMREFSKNATFRSSIAIGNHLQGLVRATKVRDKFNIVEQWIDKVNGFIPSEDRKSKSLFTKIELFVYLANIEAALNYIKFHYPIIQQYGNVDNIPMLSMVASFRPLMKEAMTGVMFGYRYEQKEGELLGNFKVIQYLAVGRELLYNWPTIYEKADKRRGPAVVLLSGTSYAPKSLHYHIEHEPNWFISSTRQTSKLEQSFLQLRDPLQDESIINISGVGITEKRNYNLKAMISELDRKIASELSYWELQGEPRRVLLVVNSYDDVEVVGNALRKIDKWHGSYRLLSRDNKKDEIFYPRSMIERFADENANILVAPMLAISRGYNIMQGQGALFGSAFFLIRPYPVPNDLSYFVQMLHGQLPLLFNRIKKERTHYVKALRMIRNESRARFELMYRKPEYWSILSEEERHILAWYTFIPTWQLIGRLLRGGKNARVFYCDGKFLDRSNGNSSLIDYWYKIMHETDDPIFKSLYGPFIESISSIIKKEVIHNG